MTNVTSPELVAAVQELYIVFGKYPRPVSIDFCPCGCTKPDATAHLVAAPLSNLRFADMLDYCFSALTTQGSVDDFRYLLPRLLQGIAEESCAFNPEIFFGKLTHAEWLTWPADEVDAVETYLKALWRTALNAFPLDEHLPAFFQIEPVLCSIARTGESLEWFLNAWTSMKTEEADRNLIQFVTQYGSDFTEGCTFSGAFWADSPTQATSLRKWLLQPDTLQRIAQAAHLLPDDGFEHLFQPAFEGLMKEAHS